MSNRMLGQTFAALLLASPGDLVTRESGEVICTVTTELRTGVAVSAEGWCKDWTIPPPINGQIVPVDAPGRQWIRVVGFGALQLHVNGEWKP